MQYLLAIFAGLIQGITEFLPISSSGHLLILHDIFQLDFFDDKFFDVALHLATLLAVVVFFRKDIEKIIRGFLSSLFNWNLANNFNQRLAWLVIIGTLPALFFGYWFDNFIAGYLSSPYTVAAALIIVGLLFFVAEKIAQKTKTIQELRPLDALLMGLAQAVALIPGVSRSGITIIAGLGRKLKREEAARFSFLLSAPVILGAGLKAAWEVGDWSVINWPVLILSFSAAAISGYLSIKFLIGFLSRYSLRVFAWYRLIIGGLILLWLFFF